MTEKMWHTLDAAEALRTLETDAHAGLAADEAVRRLETYGPNELRKEDRVSPWTIFLGQFKNILIVILLVATLLSAVVGELFDAALIFVIVVFCAVLGFVQEYQAEKALEALKKMLSPTVRLSGTAGSTRCPPRRSCRATSSSSKPDSRSRPTPGSSRSPRSSATRPRSRGNPCRWPRTSPSWPPTVRVADRANMVYTGTVITYGRGKAVVTSTGQRTEFGKIAEEVAAVEVEKTPLEKRTDEIGKWLGLVSLGICLLITVFSIVRESLTGTVDLPFIIGMVMFAISLAVAAVPEALAAIVTGALAIGMHQMAKNNALIRKMPAVETLGCTTVICSDKTGTLTKGEMTVRRVYAAGRSVEVTGVGYAPVGEFKGLGPDDAALRSDLEILLKAGLLCNDASVDEKDGRWAVKGDPTEGALIVAAAKLGLNPRSAPREPRGSRRSPSARRESG